ncbi:hypothetical protein ACI8AV_14635 [Geodermatophilus sp. SYSU D00804]
MAAVRQQPLQDRLGEEMADVLLYLLRLADLVGVDLAAAARAKIAVNEERFLQTLIGVERRSEAERPTHSTCV